MPPTYGLNAEQAMVAATCTDATLVADTAYLCTFSKPVVGARVKLPSTFGGTAYVKFNAETAGALTKIGSTWDDEIEAGGASRVDPGVLTRTVAIMLVGSGGTFGTDIIVKGWE